MRLRAPILLAAVLSAALPLTAVGPASAAPVPELERIFVLDAGGVQNPNEDLVLNALIELGKPVLDQYGNPSSTTTAPPAGTVVHARVSSCGRFLAENTATMNGQSVAVDVEFSPDGQLDADRNPVNILVGPSIDYVVTVTEPGADPYDATGSYSYVEHQYTAQRPSCDRLAQAYVGVEKWSRKRGQARIGRTLSVTPTVAPGATVTYTWRAGSRVISHGRSVRVKRGYRYAVISMKVKVTAPGQRARSKQLTWPMVVSRS